MFTGGNVNIGQIKGMIFSIQRFSTYDGPGIRTTVFLKGCPLRCLWCQNPESQSSLPEIALEKEKCIECLSKKCLTVCPTGAIWLEPRGRFIIVDRKLCNLCMKCVNVCSEGALKIIGQTVTADDVVKEVLKDAPFYRTSSGDMLNPKLRNVEVGRTLWNYTTYFSSQEEFNPNYKADLKMIH